MKLIQTSYTDDWKTPKCLLDRINELGYIDTFKFQASYNELENDYYDKKLFINPPFSKLNVVTDWVIKQLKNRNKILMIIPSRTDTAYFHKLLACCPNLYFIKGRLHYNDSKASAPFPTVALFFDTRNIINFGLPLYTFGTLDDFIDAIRSDNLGE